MTAYTVPPRLRRHLGELVRLAVPLIVTRAGTLVLALVDTLMVARYGVDDLNFQALGNGPAGALTVTIVGLMMGTMAVTSQHLGRGEDGACGPVWLRSLPFALAVGLCALLLSLFGEAFYTATGQTPENSAGGGRVVAILGYGQPAVALFLTSTFFLEGLRRPGPGMVAMLVANLVNIWLNWVLVFGHWGVPALGAEGSAWATTSVRWFLALVLIAYILRLPDGRRLGLRPLFRRRPGGSGAEQRRIGYAAGLSLGLESTAFAAMTVMAGWIGGAAPGVYSVGLTALALLFMVGIGIASATAVRVGIAYGRRDWPDLALAGWLGLVVCTVVTGGLGIALALAAPWLAPIYSDDAAMIAMIVPVLVMAGVILVPDAGQAVMAHALRAESDAWIPTWCHLASYYVVMIPAGWVLAIRLDRGVGGLQEAILIASLVSVALLGARFHWLNLFRRPA